MASQLLKKNLETNKFELNQIVLDKIREIKGNVAICLIAGRYRLGKSYLMNRLIQLFKNDSSNQSVFEISSEETSCTHGIWIANHFLPIVTNNKEELTLIFMDTEGLESKDNEAWDSKLFQISLLLSSIFIYNTQNVFSTDALHKLGSLADLSQSLKSNSKNKTNNLLDGDDRPYLLWLIRDSILNSNNMDDDSLEEFFKAKSEETNSIIENVKKFFNIEKSCLKLPMPVYDIRLLNKLNIIEKDQFNPHFLQKLNELKNNLFKKLRPKRVDVVFDGNLLCNYIKQLVDAVNQNKTLDLYDAVYKLQAEKELKLVLNEYENRMANYLVKKPSAQELQDQDNFLNANFNRYLKQKIKPYLQHNYLDEFTLCCQNKYEKFRQINNKEIELQELLREEQEFNDKMKIEKILKRKKLEKELKAIFGTAAGVIGAAAISIIGIILFKN